MIKKLLNNLFGIDFLGFSLIANDDAMTEHVRTYRLNILGSYVSTSANESMGP